MEHNDKPEAPADAVEGQEESTPTFNETSPCKGERKNADKLAIAKALVAAMTDNETFMAALNESPNMDYDKSKEGRLWLEAIARAAEVYPRDGQWDKTVRRDNSDWGQFVENEGERLSAAKPRMHSDAGSTLSGERAIFKLTSSLGLGTVVQVPLWHSGIWVTIKAPSDSSLLELERRIAMEKIDLGRHTNGLAFANTSVYINNTLMNFIVKHVYDSSLKTNSANALKREILVTDLPMLIWGMLCSIYPNGYDFAQPCIADPENCQHVTEERINIAKLCWTDRRALTKEQLTHMSKRTSKWQHQDLLDYQGHHVHGQSRVVKLNEALSVRLKVPTMAEYEAIGYEWIDHISGTANDAFDVPLTGDERNAYLNAQANVNVLRTYGHWVTEIIMDDDSNIVDRDTINHSLDRLSSNDDLVEVLMGQISKYIDESTVSVIAIPQYQCPSCGKEQPNTSNLNKHLIPLEVGQVFFTLITHRLR